MNTTSRFAATTCCSVSSPAALREKWVRRGKIASMTAVRSPGVRRIATQSPTAAMAWRPVALWSSLPECWARTSPPVV